MNLVLSLMLKALPEFVQETILKYCSLYIEWYINLNDLHIESLTTNRARILVPFMRIMTFGT